MTKGFVEKWETVAYYKSEFQTATGVGTSDCEVQVGFGGQRWFVRTTNDDGGMDEAPDDDGYVTRSDAVKVAQQLAAKLQSA